MADIFISYSKADRLLALKLSALLESYGYTTWWDSSLEPADKFRDKIMSEIDSARAVISLWTENSVKSDWVRAEAGRAKSQGKLIPVKAPGIDYDAIPLPFGEMHIEPLENDEKVLGAVKELLSKPQEKSPLLRKSLAGLRYEALGWFGIIGAVLSLATGLTGFFRLAAWAHTLVDNFASMTRWFWAELLFFLPNVTPITAWSLNIAVFMAATAISALRSNYAPPPYFSRRKIFTELAMGLGLSIIFLLFFSAIASIILRGKISQAELAAIEAVSSVVGFSPTVDEGVPMGVLIVFFILSALFIAWMNTIAWLMQKFFGYGTDQMLAVIRIWRINIGVALILGLNYLSLWLEPQCAPGRALEKLCGS